MGTWEHRNIAGSPSLHNSLGIFCWGRSLKIQREIEREVFKACTQGKDECGPDFGAEQEAPSGFLFFYFFPMMPQ
jgi:hypothetical protein